MTHFFLAHIHDRFQACRVGEIEQVGALDIAAFGIVLIPQHTMLGRA
jgi:hypothetical protein